MCKYVCIENGKKRTEVEPFLIGILIVDPYDVNKLCNQELSKRNGKTLVGVYFVVLGPRYYIEI